MCAKPEPSEYLRPLGELVEELSQWQNNPLPQLAWAGIATYYAVLENV